MGYIENNLIVGEEVISRARLSKKAILVNLLVPTLVALTPTPIMLLMILGTGGDRQVTQLTMSGSICYFILALPALMFFYLKVLIIYLTTEVGFTNQRVILKQGLIRRVTGEVFLNALMGFALHQGIIGRILGYGSFSVGGMTFCWIDQPTRFRKEINDYITTR